MRQVIASEFVSLDGVVEDPSWTFQFSSEEQQKFKFDELFASDALLLGRVTYEGFAAAWPTMTDEVGFADKMNSMPKFVVSKTLEEPLEWNNSTLIKGDVAEEVSRLMQHDLIDEYRLMVFPVVLGSGKRLFKDGSGTKVLRLVDTKTFSSGVVVLSYQPAEQEDGDAA